MELQLDVSVAPFPHTLGLVLEVSPSLPIQYGGRGRGMYEKQEGWDPHIFLPSAHVAIPLPGGQDHLSEDPSGVSKEAQHAGLPPGELHREGPALL